MRRIDLVENGPSRDEPLAPAIARALRACDLVTLQQLPGGSAWRLTPRSAVGAVSAGTCDADRVQVNVAAKLTVDRIVFLLEHTATGRIWRECPVHVEQDDYLLRAVVEAFERITRRALASGLPQRYRTIEETATVVRGRIRETDQLRRHHGLPVPVEVRYDDYTVDTGENRLLRAATARARHLPGLDRGLQRRLERLQGHFAGVTAVRRIRDLARYTPDRRHGRFGDALRLAQVIVDSSSFEHRGDGLIVDGFVINMAKVFEDFVCSALGAALRRAGGGFTRAQDVWLLDRDGVFTMQPDLVWYPDGDGPPVGGSPQAPEEPADGPTGPGADPRRPGAVVDAKYKAERASGFPNADLYQMLAYCTALGLRDGHLVYARGAAAERVHPIARSPITVHVHTLDLDRPPAALLAQVHALAGGITGNR